MEKKKYTNLGTVIAKKPDPKYPDDKRFYIKLEQRKDVKTGKAYGEQIFPITLANGKQLNDGDILNMFSKKDSFQRMVDAGKMDQAKADELSAFLLFDISLTETVNEGEPDPQPKSKSGVNF